MYSNNLTLFKWTLFSTTLECVFWKGCLIDEMHYIIFILFHSSSYNYYLPLCVYECVCLCALSEVGVANLGRTLWSTSVSRRRPALWSARRSSWSRKRRSSGDNPLCPSRKMTSERSTSSDWRMLRSGTTCISLCAIYEKGKKKGRERAREREREAERGRGRKSEISKQMFPNESRRLAEPHLGQEVGVGQ